MEDEGKDKQNKQIQEKKKKTEESNLEETRVYIGRKELQKEIIIIFWNESYIKWKVTCLDQSTNSGNTSVEGQHHQDPR